MNLGLELCQNQITKMLYLERLRVTFVTRTNFGLTNFGWTNFSETVVTVTILPVRDLYHRCMERSCDQRIQDLGDLWIEKFGDFYRYIEILESGI